MRVSLEMAEFCVLSWCMCSGLYECIDFWFFTGWWKDNKDSKIAVKVPVKENKREKISSLLLSLECTDCASVLCHLSRMGCVFGRFKSIGVLWRTFGTQVVALGKLGLSGEVSFWGREEACLPWASLWGVWALRLMYLGAGKTWNGWRVLDFDFCITVCTLAIWMKLCHRSAGTLWAVGGAEVWHLPPAVLGMGTQLDFVGETRQYNSKESSSLAWCVRGSGEPTRAESTSEQLHRETPAGIKAPAVRGHLSSAFCFKSIPGGTWGVLSTFSALPGGEKAVAQSGQWECVWVSQSGSAVGAEPSWRCVHGDTGLVPTSCHLQNWLECFLLCEVLYCVSQGISASLNHP